MRFLDQRRVSNHAGGNVLDFAGGGTYGDSTNGRPAVTYPAGDGLCKVADLQNTGMVATLSGDTDSGGNPITELKADTGAAGQLWQLTKLGIVYLHG